MLKWLALGALFGTGLASLAWAQGASKFDGQYVGELTLTKIISGDCTQPPLGARYPLMISRGVVRFKYVPRFDTVLTGRVDEEGVLNATRRLKRGSVSMSGRIEGNNVTAYLISPSCYYTFQTRN